MMTPPIYTFFKTWQWHLFVSIVANWLQMRENYILKGRKWGIKTTTTNYIFLTKKIENKNHFDCWRQHNFWNTKYFWIRDLDYIMIKIVPTYYFDAPTPPYGLKAAIHKHFDIYIYLKVWSFDILISICSKA